MRGTFMRGFGGETAIDRSVLVSSLVLGRLDDCVILLDEVCPMVVSNLTDSGRRYRETHLQAS